VYDDHLIKYDYFADVSAERFETIRVRYWAHAAAMRI
jgi:hypothetical protein